jgi:hypothetical protein
MEILKGKIYLNEDLYYNICSLVPIEMIYINKNTNKYCKNDILKKIIMIQRYYKENKLNDLLPRIYKKRITVRYLLAKYTKEQILGTNLLEKNLIIHHYNMRKYLLEKLTDRHLLSIIYMCKLLSNSSF